MRFLGWLALGLTLAAFLVLSVGAWAYLLGRTHGLRRAKALALTARPGTLDPMPPERAWRLGAERVVALIDQSEREPV